MSYLYLSAVSTLLIFGFCQYVSGYSNETNPSTYYEDPYGILHTLDSFIAWTIYEEEINSILAARLAYLKKFQYLINANIGSGTTRLVASKALRRSLANPSKYLNKIRTLRLKNRKLLGKICQYQLFFIARRFA